MSGFNSGAIDPALLGGGGGITPAPFNRTSTQSNLHNSTIGLSNPGNANNISSTLSAPLVPASLNSNGFINQQFPFANHSSHAQLQSSSSCPANGMPSKFPAEPLMENGMSIKEHEMHQKDQELAQFLLQMENYKPVIPDEVAGYYLQRVGFECSDVRVQRLLVLACQKFVSDIAQDAFSYASTRAGQAPGGRQGQLVANTNSAGLQNGSTASVRRDRTRTVLTQEDLSQALAEYGINASRAPYYL